MKFEENMNVCLLSCRAVFMPSMKCKKSMNVCPFSCSAVFYVLLAVMCIYVIYKCFCWGLISNKIWASQAKNSNALPSAWEVVERPMLCGE